VDGALVAVVAVALGFAWVNGFHDASNSVATPLATRALTPRVALPLAAVLNGVGALLGVMIVATLASVVTLDPGSHGLLQLLAALAAAIGWGLLTWLAGIPSSSSHALIGGLVGAALATGAAVNSEVVVRQVVLPTLISPVVGLVGAWLLVLALDRVFRDAAYGHTLRGFRMAQAVAAASTAVGHGLQDGQKAMGVIVLALATDRVSGRGAAVAVPLWVRVSVAVVLALGTAAGGWRIIRTLGRRIVPIDPVTGFAAQGVASIVLSTTGGIYAAPISTTHTLTAAVLGAGATRGLRTVRWTMVRRIATAWVLTPLATAAAAAGIARGLFALAG
jgi:PiT family inorganic phosphate transporter